VGIEKVFAFTLIPAFFENLGFQPRQHEELPLKVWGECSRCPKYFTCDEIGMIREL
jgi:amino-acid N-acetyltransferase